MADCDCHGGPSSSRGWFVWAQVGAELSRQLLGDTEQGDDE